MTMRQVGRRTDVRQSKQIQLPLVMCGVNVNGQWDNADDHPARAKVVAIRNPQPEGWGGSFRYRRDTHGLEVPSDLRERFLDFRGRS
jgi:hypothetical protein